MVEDSPAKEEIGPEALAEMGSQPGIAQGWDICPVLGPALCGFIASPSALPAWWARVETRDHLSV